MHLHILKDIGAREPHVVNLRCPACMHKGSFAGFPKCADVTWKEGGWDGYAGMRRCPNVDCRSLIFVAQQEDTSRYIYPPEIINFDASGLPAQILASLEEAIQCHAANCYKASALMVRRVLEELCEDKAAKGKDLKARIAALGNSAVVPQELLNAADELRILGNDAAHVEAKDYDSIGQVESELAIELAKELLKAVYQYSNLVTRLQALKKSP